MFVLIADNMILKFKKRYQSEDDMYDCKQQGVLHLFNNWKSFNEKKFSSSLPYFSEVFKRGVVDGFYQIINKKSYGDKNVRTISLDSANEGKGLNL